MKKTKKRFYNKIVERVFKKYDIPYINHIKTQFNMMFYIILEGFQNSISSTKIIVNPLLLVIVMTTTML